MQRGMGVEDASESSLYVSLLCSLFVHRHGCLQSFSVAAPAPALEQRRGVADLQRDGCDLPRRQSLLRFLLLLVGSPRFGRIFNVLWG